MQYYYLKNSTERKVIGRKYPQCSAYPHELGYNWSYAELPNSMTKIPIDSFANLEPLIVFELENSSKLTDVLSNATIHANGLLISERTKILFDENLNIPNSKYYDAQIYFKEQIYKYYFLHILPCNLNAIDFNNSKFSLFEKVLEYKFIKTLNFNNSSELLKFYTTEKQAFQKIRADKINFDVIDIDLYYFDELNTFHEFIVTEKFADLLTKNKITGLEITLID